MDHPIECRVACYAVAERLPNIQDEKWCQSVPTYKVAISSCGRPFEDLTLRKTRLVTASWVSVRKAAALDDRLLIGSEGLWLYINGGLIGAIANRGRTA